jgi:hypothetical protein
VKEQPQERSSRTEPCGCVVTEAPGHRHTKLCAQHHTELYRRNVTKGLPNNLDLVGG